MARIVLLGCAGSGKSTLARRYAERTGAALICLDAIWTPGADVAQFRETLRRLHAGEAWISDGNFAAVSFDLRLPRATQIVWLDRPRISCAGRAVRRACTPGTDHALRDLPKVLRFIAGFDRVNRPLIEAQIREHRPEVSVVRLRTDREVESFLAEFNRHGRP